MYWDHGDPQEALPGMLDRVKSLMDERGLKDKDVFSNMHGWGPKKFSRFMRGDWLPWPGLVNKLSGALGVSEEWLWGDTDDPKPVPKPPRQLRPQNWEDLRVWLTDYRYENTEPPWDLKWELRVPLPAWVAAVKLDIDALNEAEVRALCCWLADRHQRKSGPRLRVISQDGEKVIDFQERRRARGH